MAKRILVLGGGFAGLWSAVGAARKLDELKADDIEVTLVNRDDYHNIRVRNYEADLSAVRVPLADVLDPIGVKRVEGAVKQIDLNARSVSVTTATGQETLPYDRLVFALGSQLYRPNIPGLAEHAFDVDSYPGAARLEEHLHSLPQLPDAQGRFTVAVVGAGLTGIEAAADMPGRLRTVLDQAKIDRPIRVILLDRNPHIGSDMGESARPVIEQALSSLGVEMRPGVDITAVTPQGLTLSSGEQIAAATVVWTAGMRASPLTAQFPVERDPCGRLTVDEYMRVAGVEGFFAAGDSARAMMDDSHPSVMSCQHGRPMGRFAGHNVVCDLLGLPMLPLRISWYVTVLDLGPWGALYTEGWNRRVVTTGETAKRTKQEINCRRIYPPLNRDRRAILDAAAPVVQNPPATYQG